MPYRMLVSRPLAQQHGGTAELRTPSPSPWCAAEAIRLDPKYVKAYYRCVQYPCCAFEQKF